MLYLKIHTLIINNIFFLQVDLSHIYGDNLDRQNKLRLLKDGKLRYQVGKKKKKVGPLLCGTRGT